MENKTLLEKIKTLLFAEDKAPVEETFKDYKLKDGTTVIRIDGEIKEGTQVNVVSEDGLVPAPKGDHEIPELKQIITVDDEGKITKVVDMSAEKEEDLEEVAPEATEEVVTNGNPVEDRVSALETKLAELEEVIMMIANKVSAPNEEDSNDSSDELNKIKAEMENLKLENESLLKSPAAPSIKTKKVDTEMKLENESLSPKKKIISEIEEMRLAQLKKYSK